jgi:hypothetical protein
MLGQVSLLPVRQDPQGSDMHSVKHDPGFGCAKINKGLILIWFLLPLCELLPEKWSRRRNKPYR